MKTVFIVAVIVLPLGFAPSVHAGGPSGHGPPMTWSRVYGPGSISYSMAQSFDGGLVVAGLGVGGRVLKLNPVGKPMWEMDYLPEGYAAGSVEADSIQQTSDGGYIVAGDALSLRYVTSYDAWLLKLDHQGEVEWSRTYGGSGDERFFSVEQTLDGGFMVGGSSGSGTSQIHAWLIKLDSAGSIQWQHSYVGSGWTEIRSAQQTSDGGFIVAGKIPTGDAMTAWVFKTDSGGKMLWQKSIAVEPRDNHAYWAQQTHDGGYVVAGDSSLGALVLRLDDAGGILWARSLGGVEVTTYSVHETFDGGFIVAGRSLGPVSGPWLVRLDAEGDVSWGRFYGGGFSFLFDAQQVGRGGSRARESQSGEGFVAVGTNLCCGFWVLRLDDQGNLEGCPLEPLSSGWVNSVAINAEDTSQFSFGGSLAGHFTAVVVKTLQATLQEQCPFPPNG